MCESAFTETWQGAARDRFTNQTITFQHTVYYQFCVKNLPYPQIHFLWRWQLQQWEVYFLYAVQSEEMIKCIVLCIVKALVLLPPVLFFYK